MKFLGQLSRIVENNEFASEEQGQPSLQLCSVLSRRPITGLPKTGHLEEHFTE